MHILSQRITSLLLSSLLTIAVAACGTGNDDIDNSTKLEFDAASPQASYAADKLISAIKENGLESSGFRVTLSLNPNGMKPESFAISPGERSVAISASDGRGLIYGALNVAEKIRNGKQLDQIQQEKGEPSLPFRAIKFNTPWESYRSSSAIDQHTDTVKDVKYWEKFLDMMVENRFNTLTLWNLHPFPYMIRAKNYPEASRFTDEELAEWKKLYKAIFHMAEVRGIDTYLLNWNILVSESFAKHHGLKKLNYYPYYRGEGDTSELIKSYTRESVTQLLQEYPELDGFGFQLGEQMDGMTPVERQQWIDDVMIAGMRDAKRPVKMIFRMPQSAGTDIGGSTSKEVELLTRNAIEKLGNDFNGPIWAEFKFNWSHGHSTTELVKIHGGALTDTFFTPTPKNYKVTWMVRNEDFFALRWGAPNFVREHILRNGVQDYMGGYFVGSETYIPAKDYFTALDAPVAWKYAFERQWLFYKLWGRLLYDPKTPDSIFEAEFVRRYGEGAKSLLSAYEKASSTQLNFATSIDFLSDTMIYSEGMMVYHPTKSSQPMTVDRLISTKPGPSSWLSVKDYVAKKVAGETIAQGITTPLALADRLEADNTEALRLVKGIDVSKDASLLYEVSDVKTWANLGLYYAEKLRGAVALQTYRTAGGEQNKLDAVAHLDKSLAYWDEVVAITRPLYKDMPLVHYNPLGNVRNDNNLFHWALIRPEIAADIQTIKSTLASGK